MGRQSKRATKIRQASEFNTARLNALIERPRASSSAVYAWSLAEIFNARNMQMVGNFALAARMAESMGTDDALFVARSNRLAPQRCTAVELVPASDKGKAVSVCGEAEALFGQDGVGIAPGAISDINRCFVDHGVAIGYNVTQPRDDGSRIDIEHRYWPIEFVRWDAYRRIYLARVDPSTVNAGDLVLPNPELGSVGAFEVPIVHGDGRWAIYAGHSVDPFRHDAALLAASAIWARHAFAIRDWSKGSVAHGSAKVIGEMPAGVALQDVNGLTAEAAAMMDLLRSIGSSDAPVGLRPSGSKIDFLTNTSTAWNVWASLVENAERAAARVYLGTDGVLGSVGGAPGVDVASLFGVATTKVQGDLAIISRGLQTGVIEVWAALNFGDSSLAPTRRYMLPDADADAARASVGTRRAAFHSDIASAKSNGFIVDQKLVDATAAAYDVPAPLLPPETGAKAPTIALAPTDLARVISVNEARASAGLGVLALPDGKPDPDGLLTVEAFGAKGAAKLDPPASPATP